VILRHPDAVQAVKKTIADLSGAGAVAKAA